MVCYGYYIYIYTWVSENRVPKWQCMAMCTFWGQILFLTMENVNAGAFLPKFGTMRSLSTCGEVCISDGFQPVIIHRPGCRLHYKRLLQLLQTSWNQQLPHSSLSIAWVLPFYPVANRFVPRIQGLASCSTRSTRSTRCASVESFCTSQTEISGYPLEVPKPHEIPLQGAPCGWAPLFLFVHGNKTIFDSFGPQIYPNMISLGKDVL